MAGTTGTTRSRSIAPHQRRVAHGRVRGVLVIRRAPDGDGWRVWDEDTSEVRSMSGDELRLRFPVVTGTAQEWWRGLARTPPATPRRPSRRRR